MNNYLSHTACGILFNLMSIQDAAMLTGMNEISSSVALESYSS